MLLTFRVANHRSLHTEQELSLVATEFNEHTARPTTLRQDGRRVSLLPVLGIFGSNGSGKSNVLSALHFMRSAVLDSFADWGKLDGVPREPFALSPTAREETSLYEVELLLEGVRHTYGFEVSGERVEAEWLHAYPTGRRQVWFERRADRPENTDEFRFPGARLGGSKSEYIRFTRHNALFLTVAAAMNHPQLSAVHRWFSDNVWLVTSGQDVLDRAQWTRRRLTGDTAFRERLVLLLRAADLGVTDLALTSGGDEIQLLHQRSDGQSDVALDFWSQESWGTHAWFSFLGPLIDVLDRGGTLLADELDSSLHPRLAAEVVRLFQDDGANPRQAQLVFTTHDATLLGPSVAERPLDRDQVWITAKNSAGETDLYPLIDAHKARKDENLERRYLRGHYGGVPRVGEGRIARELRRWEASA